MVETEDAPGHVDILTMERQYVGSCDIRGMMDASGIQQSHAILIQIWVEDNKGQGSNCNVMLISPQEFPAGDQNQQLDLVKALADHCSTVPQCSKATAQWMNKNPISSKDGGRLPVLTDCTPFTERLATRKHLSCKPLRSWICQL
jgi:hypothetical protein